MRVDALFNCIEGSDFPNEARLYKYIKLKYTSCSAVNIRIYYIMTKKYFIRRIFAYLIDILILSIFFAIFAVAINSVFNIKFVAPELIKYSACQDRQMISAERMSALLPLSGTQKHQQIFCTTTTMGITTFHTATLRRMGKVDGRQNIGFLSYYVDKDGKQANVYSIDPFLTLIAPFIFALFVSRRGRTYGKQALGLVIFDSSLANPNFSVALKREYLKAIPMILAAFVSIHTMYQLNNFDLDAAALKLIDISSATNDGSLSQLFLLGAVTIIGSIGIWYNLGSFIRWRGQTYWDKWTNLSVDSNNGLIDKSRDQQIKAIRTQA